MTVRIFTGDLDTFDQQQQSIRDSKLQPFANSSEMSSHSQVSRWLIVGAGGFGREVYSWTSGQLHSKDFSTRVGFLDDNPDCLHRFPHLNHLWAGRIADYSPEPGDRLLMAIADPTSKLAAGALLTERGGSFASFVHPTAVLSPDVDMGIGCILCPLSVVCCNVVIGDFVAMNVGSLAGHDSILSEGCTLSPHANVAGQVKLERGVFMGCQAVILPKVNVGEYARIGAGSTVIGHVRANSTMMGVPAKRVSWSRSLEDADQDVA